MRTWPSPARARCIWFEPEVAEQVTGYRVHRGALASMQRLPLPPWLT